MSYASTFAILSKLSPGSPVSIWFDDSGFIATYYQFSSNGQAAFSGGGLDGGLTYININELVAVKVGH